MADIPITELTREGVELAPAIAASATDTIVGNDGLLVVEIENPTGAPLVCEFEAQVEMAGVAYPALEVTVPANTTVWVRPLPPVLYNDTSGDVIVHGATGLLLRGLRF